MDYYDDDDYDYNYTFYNYTYDYEEAISHLPLKEFIPVVTLYAITGLVGLIGNLLVVFAIANFPRMRSITNWFLLSLACADLLLVLVCVPVKAAGLYSYTWRMGDFLCTFVAYIQNVSMICSVMTLTVMSIERFLAILFPLKARYICTMNHTRVVIVGIWLMSFVMAIPIIFGKYIQVVKGVNRTALWCKIQFSSFYFKLYELYMLVIMFIIPVMVMAVCYTMISIEIWHIVSNRAMMRSGSECQYTCSERIKSSSSNGDCNGKMKVSTKKPPAANDDDARTRKQVIMMLIVVVFLFAVCWGPILINNVLVSFGILSDLHDKDYLKHMRSAFSLMSYANSCINPIVYGFMSKNFRDTFKHAINNCLKRGSSMARLPYVTDITRGSILKSSNSAGSDEKDTGFVRVDNNKGNYTAVEMKPIRYE